MHNRIHQLLAAVVACVLVGSIPTAEAAGSSQAVLTDELPAFSAAPAAGSYQEYRQRYADMPVAQAVFSVHGADYSYAEAEVERLENYEGYTEASLFIPDSGRVEWTVEVPEEGFYNLGLYYFPVEGKGADIERSFYIDGESPFTEAESLTFSRVWVNAIDTIEQDNRGNDIYPEQVEAPIWRFEAFRDYMGYVEEPFVFYFTEGTHVLALESIKEPVVLGEIRFYHEKALRSYADVKAEYDAEGYQPVTGADTLYMEAEMADAKSSSMLSPVYDRSSPLVSPSDATKLKLNILGGGRWNAVGQWVEYQVDVKTSGLYKISLKIRQNSARGLIVSRRLYIDGEVPFEEANRIEYAYGANWRVETLGGDDPYWIYLSAGLHTIKLEAILGGLSSFCSAVSNSVSLLNEAYRKIVMVTGPTPDTYRDYYLDKQVPDVIALFAEQQEMLTAISNAMQAFTGGRSSYTAILDTVAYQLGEMYTRPDKIPKKLQAFNDNLSALGTWVLNVRQVSLDMDFLILSGDGYELPRADANVWESFVYGMESFLGSFVEDYSTIGGRDVQTDVSITVWINSGRDQAQILKQMIDSYFVPRTNIGVNVQLVQDALLQATVAGLGPDVALTVGQGDPVNYAIRGAVLDLTQFDSFQETSAQFAESAMLPMRFNGGVYGLPEKTTFPMLFYRKDILEEIGVSVPETWDDVYAMLPILQRYNMQFGLPTSDLQTNNGAGFLSFGMLLYQKGGAFYSEAGDKALLDSEESISAMKAWSEFYTNYKQPKSFDFPNRFRSGEMPIGISDYTTYNMLTAFAPEIRNQWGFTSVPGIVRADGTVDHTSVSSTTPCMILSSTEYPEESWKFVEWWVSADTQLEFGRGLESLLGETGRYPTANLEAISKLAWSSRDFTQLMGQYEQVRGVPEVPGGYFAWRHVDNAFRTVVDRGIDVREVMMDYNRTINQEITFKREEFSLQ